MWVCSLEEVGSVYDHALMFFFLACRSLGFSILVTFAISAVFRGLIDYVLYKVVLRVLCFY